MHGRSGLQLRRSGCLNCILLKSALIIFVRNPILGKVKSRLAATLGEEMALDIYKALLTHTRNISISLSCDKYIFYEDFVNQNDLWSNDVYYKSLQDGIDLGSRMKNAFKQLYDDAYHNVIIIGSDCYELSAVAIAKAFHLLSENDVVIGPASDGGYYLLGMKKFIPELFDNKRWSSENVYVDTVNDLERLHYQYVSLELLSDVDVESDIDAEKLNKLLPN